MATRGTIAIERDDGTIAQVYSHWDNYLSENGRILFVHYSDPEKIEQLIANGDLSSLRPEVGEKHNFDARFDNSDPRNNWTRFYGRDRDESDCEARTFANFKDYCDNAQMEEYNYIYRKNGWYVQNSYLGNGDFYPILEAFDLEALAQG